MKKFINRPENAVEEMLQGMTVLSPGLDRLPGHRVMFRADAEQIRDKRVAISLVVAVDTSPRTRGTSAKACSALESRVKFSLRRMRIPFSQLLKSSRESQELF